MLARENQPSRENLQNREIREIREPKAVPTFPFPSLFSCNYEMVRGLQF